MRRITLADVTLFLLAVVVLTFAVYVVRHDEQPPRAGTDFESNPSPAPSSPAIVSPSSPVDPAPEPEPEAPAPVLVIGDDTARLAGDGALWPAIVADEIGAQVRNLSRKGTGYATTAGEEQCGLPECPNFLQMIAVAKRQGASYGTIVVSGGQWDASLGGREANRAVRDFYAALTSAFPQARVLALPPLAIAPESPSTLKDLRATVAAAAEDFGAQFVDVGQPFARARAGADFDVANVKIAEGLAPLIASESGN